MAWKSDGFAELGRREKRGFGDKTYATPVVTVKLLFTVVTKKTKPAVQSATQIFERQQYGRSFFSRQKLYPIPVPRPQGNPVRFRIDPMRRLALEHTA